MVRIFNFHNSFSYFFFPVSAGGYVIGLIKKQSLHNQQENKYVGYISDYLYVNCTLNCSFRDMLINRPKKIKYKQDISLILEFEYVTPHGEPDNKTYSRHASCDF